MFNLSTIVLISHTSKVMLKILHARLQQYVNRELPDVQTVFRKGKRNQRSNCQHSLDHRERREFQKNMYFCFFNYTKAFDCVDHNKLWKTLKEKGISNHLSCLLRNLGIPDHLNCLLRSLYAGQETTIKSLYGATDWFRIDKGVQQGCLWSPCWFNLYTEYIMRNARLDELQAGIKTARRSINNLRYADDTTRMAES